MNAIANKLAADPLPIWLPDPVRHYLAHTESGLSIRELSRRAGCHASTVMRQVRKFENRRDDPLINHALGRLGAVLQSADTSTDPARLLDTIADSEVLRVLRRLCEPGAILAFAEEMEKAVIVRDGQDGSSTRTAVLDVWVAEALALQEWISCSSPGRVSKYRINQGGRQRLTQLVSAAESRGMAEAQAGFTGIPKPESGKKARYFAAESPLVGLSRRRDKGGQPFLSQDLVAAGERLREDFELAQVAKCDDSKWAEFVTMEDVSASEGPAPASGPEAARRRVAEALADLGPGLGDMLLRCCCFLEGLEVAEKRMGWSARSGKIVLRIALQRLKRHYDEQGFSAGPLIG